ncbi:histidine phosphatase family protein [Mariprofundus erugo]|uniref:phosphoglycerate mutase (2,3-diphosphoglycerate-dependent) n=1 Tax=Mariprofundus erugo TaxID=2528639 RepID=A0A5R9GSJ1_9PROT|nr:histidine phosphatase family protein [Mariprofundus erugo]TLS69161.1 histidine phosphatase family protein [Mariprofundus erugo]TLS74284.1 histidine phosphatase family protein [Mariprofundus erugo]
MLTLDLLRHGALQGGVKYRGQTEGILTQDGYNSMDAVWQQLAGHIDCIVTSPLSRCANPATAWAKQQDIPCIIEPRVAEMHYGAWEDKTAAEIGREFPGMIEQWRRDPTGMRPPGGESPEELRLRLHSWLTETIATCQGQHLLLVSHSGSLRMLISMALGAPIAATRQLSMPYSCWSRLQCNHQGITLEFHCR